jgi:hypothetical protein
MTLAAFNKAGKRDRFSTDSKDRPMNRAKHQEGTIVERQIGGKHGYAP